MSAIRSPLGLRSHETLRHGREVQDRRCLPRQDHERGLLHARKPHGGGNAEDFGHVDGFRTEVDQEQPVTGLTPARDPQQWSLCPRPEALAVTHRT